MMGVKLKGLILACNETKKLIKDIRFILNGYMNIINENNLSFCSKKNIERLLSDMERIEEYFKKIKAVRILKTKVSDLVDSCILNIRLFYNFLNDFILGERHLWNINNSEEIQY